MKALTLHQPWASLIALGVKTIETRSWSTKYRGPLAVHAGSRQVHTGQFFMLARDAVRFGQITREQEAEFRALDVPLGAIVATCELVDVVPMEVCNERRTHVCESGGALILHSPLDQPFPDGETEHLIDDQRPYGDFTPGRYAWLLDDIKPTTERCPVCLAQPDFRRSASVIAADGSCAACGDTGKCDPIPAKGKQGIWNWNPVA